MMSAVQHCRRAVTKDSSFVENTLNLERFRRGDQKNVNIQEKRTARKSPKFCRQENHKAKETALKFKAVSPLL